MKRHGAFETSISGNLVHYASSTSRFTHDRDTVWISSEEMDVLLYPFQSKPLVKQPGVCSARLLESRSGEETESSQAVIYRDVDDAVIASVDKTSRWARIKARLITSRVTSSVNPHCQTISFDITCSYGSCIS